MDPSNDSDLANSQVDNKSTNESVRDYLEVFVLSESGKPIYCYKKRDDEATLLPLCQALINFFCNTQNDTLKYVLLKSGLKVTFSVKSPLILIVINHQFSGLDSNLIINQLYAQIISTVTNKTLKSVYEQSPKFDLRRLLGNSEKMIDYLVEDGLFKKQLKNLTRRAAKQPQTDKASDRQSDRQSDSISIIDSDNGSIKPNEKDEIFCFLTSVTQSYSNTVRQNALAITSSSSSLTSNIYKPHLNRVLIPVLPLNQASRDSITNTLTSSIASSSVDILYSILIKFDNDLVVGEEDNETTHQVISNDQSSSNQQNDTQTNQQSSPNEESIKQASSEIALSSNQEESNVKSELSNDDPSSEQNESNVVQSVASDETELKNHINELNLEDELSEELLMKEEMKPTANCHLITIANQSSKITKLNSLDAHIVINLMLVLKNQLNTVESLWLPVCLPRFNNNAFMHAHLCLLNLAISEDAGLKNRFGLIQLTTNKEDFDKCQLAKNIINERLSKVTIVSCPFTENNIPILHAFWYQSLRSQTLVWKSKYCQNKILCKNDYLIHYMAKRMMESNLKTFWIRSDRYYIALLGWHSPTFQLYVQFDVITKKSIALNAVQHIIKWIKKEEDKILIKDYQ